MKTASLACALLACACGEDPHFASAPPGSTLYALATNSREVFFAATWLDGLGGVDGGLYRVSSSGGEVSQLSSQAFFSFPLATDSQLFWFAGPTNGAQVLSLMSESLDGGSPVTLTPPQPEAIILGAALHGGRVYWTSFGGPGATPPAPDSGLLGCVGDGVLRSVAVDGGDVVTETGATSFGSKFLISIETAPFVDDTGAYFIGRLGVELGAPTDGGLLECQGGPEQLLHLPLDGGAGDVLADLVFAAPTDADTTPVCDGVNAFFVSLDAGHFDTLSVPKGAGVSPFEVARPAATDLGPGVRVIVLDGGTVSGPTLIDGGEVDWVTIGGGVATRKRLGDEPRNVGLWVGPGAVYATHLEQIDRFEP